RVLHQKIDTVVYEITSLAEQDQEGRQKREALAQEISQSENRERELQQQVADFSAGLEGLRQQRDLATSALTETKVALATEEQLSSSFQSQQKPLQARIQELNHLAEQRRTEIGSFIQRRS